MKKVLALTLALLMVCVMTMWAVPCLAAGPALEAAPTDAVTDLTAPVEDADGSLTEVEGPTSIITQAVNNVVSAVIKFVFAAVTLLLTKYAIPFARNTVAPFIRNTIIPWLEEHRLRAMVDRLVHGAEQLANSGQIPKADKKQYVVDMLTAMGIEVTPEVDAIIEGAVLDLGKTMKELLQTVLDYIKDESDQDPEPGPDPVPQAEPAPEHGDEPNAGEA